LELLHLPKTNNAVLVDNSPSMLGMLRRVQSYVTWGEISNETIVALHELESMQEDLMKLFSERFGDLTSKVDELRTRIDLKPIKEIKVQLPSTEPSIEAEDEEEEEAAGEGEKETDKPKKKRKPPTEKTSEKTEAEKRIDEIRGEVEKVLDRLGQMEVET